MDALHFLAGAVAASLIWLAVLRVRHRLLPTLLPGRKVLFRDRPGGLRWFVVTATHHGYDGCHVELEDLNAWTRRNGVR